jgi:hypothetical protein
MARGADAKLEKKQKRKEARAAEAARILGDDELYNEFSNIDSNVEEDDGSDAGDADAAEALPGQKTKKTKKIKRKGAAAMKAKEGVEREDLPQPASSKPGIKTAPLVLLILMLGTTIIPAILYAGDWFGAFLQNNHILGSIGHTLGIGPSPKKRVLSFYEKHDPTKLDEVPTILGKYYGDYPKLVKNLERKYGDYGYFINWDQDEAPMQLAKEKLEMTRVTAEAAFQKHAPQVVKTGVRNMKYNLGFMYKKGKRLWKKHAWPVLEPFFGVPKGGAAQKRKDAQQARSRKPGRKTDSFRDDDEM